MALKPGFLLLLWHLTLFGHGITSSCNVTCSTDYNVSLNCSCGSVLTHSVVVHVSCSDEETVVNGSCEVKPPQSWCAMYLEMLYEVASVDTMCTATVQQGDHLLKGSESSIWALSNVVKPEPPFSIQVTKFEEFYNITWDHVNHVDCLSYTVRIRDREGSSKDPVYSVSLEGKHLLLDQKRLQPQVNYTVDVKTKMCPGNVYLGPWSEWSSTVEWRTAGTTGSPESEEIDWRLFSIPAFVLTFVLVFLSIPCLIKKFKMNTFIPKPDDFFTPLYHNYGGNFKEWVKPVFSEYDYLLISSQVQLKSEYSVLQWNVEKPSYKESNEMKQNGHFAQSQQPPNNSLLIFQGGSSQATSHSTGHISIHTVTLSGEEGFEEEVMSQSSCNALAYQDGDGLFREDSREEAGFDLEEAQNVSLNRESRTLPQTPSSSAENINFPPAPHFIEAERASLDSLALNEQSEDGYPHMDLDTIDSGFGECSSPGASDSNGVAQTNSDSFPVHISLNSNYVKQWMVCNTVQEG